MKTNKNMKLKKIKETHNKEKERQIKASGKTDMLKEKSETKKKRKETEEKHTIEKSQEKHETVQYEDENIERETERDTEQDEDKVQDDDKTQYDEKHSDEQNKRKCQRRKTPFSKLGLHESILFALFAQKYFIAAYIQKKTIPELIKRKNILLHSETGSGKTLCFVIPILQRLIRLKKLDAECNNVKEEVVELNDTKDKEETSKKEKEGEKEREKEKENGKKEASIVKEIGEMEKREGIKIMTDIEERRKKNEKDNIDVFDENAAQEVYDAFDKINIDRCETKSIKKINIKQFITYQKKIIEDKKTVENMQEEQKDDYRKKKGTNNKKCKKEEDNKSVQKIEEDQQSLLKEEGKRKGKTIRKKICCKRFKNKGDEKIRIYSIIITPTRELCIQIYTLIKRMIFFMRYYFSHMYHDEVGYIEWQHFFINVMLYIGTVKIDKDLQKIKKEKRKKNRYNIIVSTPGKLSRLLNDYTEHFNLSNVKYLILDEGDKLLEKTFLHYINSSINKLYDTYCTCICSATCLHEEQFYFSFSNKKKSYVKCINNKNTAITNFQLPQRLENYYIVLRNIDKQLFLFKFLNTVVHKNEAVVIFFATCFCVDYFYHIFNILFNNTNKDGEEENLIHRIIKTNRKYKIYEDSEENLLPLVKFILYKKKYIGNNDFHFLKIHRRLKGKERNNAFLNILNKKDDKKKVILATDVMSRGVNINVQWVVNYDVANRNVTYVHRSGRTSRYNETGKALILLNKKEEEYIFYLKSKNVHITNLKHTNMYKQMIKKEEDFIQIEQNLNEQTLEIAKQKKLTITTESEQKIQSFFENQQTTKTTLTTTTTTTTMKPTDTLEKNKNPSKKTDFILQGIMVECFLKIVSFLVVEYREIYVLAKKAFLSYIEFYKNHQLSFIFKLEKLNLAHLCFNFGLVRAPKFKDGLRIKGYKSLNVNTDDIAYKDKKKEKERKEAMALSQQLEKNKKKHKQKQKNESREDSDDSYLGNKKKKKKWERIEKQMLKQQEELDYLNWEEQLYKKLKKRKISQQEYDSLVGMNRIEKMLSSNDNLSKRRNFTINNNNNYISTQEKQNHKSKKNRTSKGVKHFIQKVKKRHKTKSKSKKRR